MFKLYFFGKERAVGKYVGPVPYLSSLIDDPYYYAIAKFFITKDQLARHAGQQFMVLWAEKPLETMLKTINEATCQMLLVATLILLLMLTFRNKVNDILLMNLIVEALYTRSQTF